MIDHESAYADITGWGALASDDGYSDLMTSLSEISSKIGVGQKLPQR